MKAEEAIRLEEEKERERRERNLVNRKEINQLNEKNKELRALELQKEKEEEARIEEYRKKQGTVPPYHRTHPRYHQEATPRPHQLKNQTKRRTLRTANLQDEPDQEQRSLKTQQPDLRTREETS